MVANANFIVFTYQGKAGFGATIAARFESFADSLASIGVRFAIATESIEQCLKCIRAIP